MSGGVRKMLDYVGHARSFPDYRPFVHFPPHRHKPGSENVYLRHLDASLLIDDISALRPDLVFSFITHKPYLRSQGAWRDEVPIMRLQQGFRGMERGRPSYYRQCDRVITISVGQGLGQAFRALCPNSVNRVIPNAVDVAEIARKTVGVKKQEVLTIFGYKNPRLAERVQHRVGRSAYRFHSYRARSPYSYQLRNLYRHFHRDQVLILNSAELLANHRRTLRRVFAFLGVREVEMAPIVALPGSLHGKRRHPILSWLLRLSFWAERQRSKGLYQPLVR